jgi:hypothetical protein
MSIGSINDWSNGGNRVSIRMRFTEDTLSFQARIKNLISDYIATQRRAADKAALLAAENIAIIEGLQKYSRNGMVDLASVKVIMDTLQNIRNGFAAETKDTANGRHDAANGPYDAPDF